MMLTLMDQQVFIPTLLTIVISFDKITVSDGWQQVMTRICLDTIITSWHHSQKSKTHPPMSYIIDTSSSFNPKQLIFVV